ncbi:MULTISPECIES: sulfatase [unclassified Streptomyces]|uniref:sulfatase family protein n=1 Tax=unclassified Streptomyces TaxID=2593676 RepID=UPI001F2143DF|nr:MULTISPECIES: sulfatase-like hydrolase/transferase [unclassified Streptomyces]MCU4745395.1 sulfatase-like hydrolase/transferase [Streptomyces sp. G-5]
MNVPQQGLAISRRAFGAAVGVGATSVAGGTALAAGAEMTREASAARAARPQERPFAARGATRSPRPNILFIMGDDIGWGDLSCYGARHIETPHLDRLAAEGVRLTDGYSGSSTCSPTRISLYTGRYPQRIPAGLAEPIEDEAPLGLEPTHPTLASLLGDAGYTTSMIGKWHCGELPDYSPVKSGWDEFFGNFGGALEYYSKLTTLRGYGLYEGETEYKDLRYYTRVLSERAADFITRQHTEPWLLNLNFTSAHWPWIAEGDMEESARLERLLREAPSEQSKLVMAHLDGGSLDTYAKMVQSLDRAVGEVLHALDRSGQAQDTIVIFSSDNGGERYSHSWPFLGMKHTLQEGGIRVPTILRWPARVDAHQVSHVPVFSPDWTATLLDVAGARSPKDTPLDGVSLAGYLLDGEAAPTRDLFWRQEGERALRRGKWKYHYAETAKIPPFSGQHVLFDLEADPSENANKGLQEPQLLAELKAAWEDIDSELLPYPS